MRCRWWSAAEWDCRVRPVAGGRGGERALELRSPFMHVCTWHSMRAWARSSAKSPHRHALRSFTPSRSRKVTPSHARTPATHEHICTYTHTCVVIAHSERCGYGPLGPSDGQGSTPSAQGRGPRTRAEGQGPGPRAKDHPTDTETRHRQAHLQAAHTSAQTRTQCAPSRPPSPRSLPPVTYASLRTRGVLALPTHAYKRPACSCRPGLVDAKLLGRSM